MNEQAERYLSRAVELSQELCTVATAAEHAGGTDDNLLAFCGVLRDCAYRIQRDAGKELRRLARAQ